MSTLRSRVQGSLYGLAAGDALGAPYEFKFRKSYKVTADMEENRTFSHNGRPLPPGTWTDDTTMALGLAKSLVQRGALDWEDVARKWVAWYEKGELSPTGTCFDIGNQIRLSLRTYILLIRDGASWPDGPQTNTNRSSSGNGAIMRLAPLPAWHAKRSPVLTPVSMRELLSDASLSCRITHGSDLCVDTTRLLAFYLTCLFHSDIASAKERKEHVLQAGFIPAGLDESGPGLETEEVTRIWKATSFKTLTSDTVNTSGFTVTTLEAALWALWDSDSFEEGMLKLIPLGQDVDTVCAVYGQLAGACYGFEAIPQRWLDRLQRRDLLDSSFLPLLP